MWKPNNPSTSPNASPSTQPTAEPGRPVAAPQAVPEPTPVQRGTAVLNNQEQATIGKSLVIKGEVTGSESLYIDGKVEGSINLQGNRVTVGRNGQVTANINAREIVVLGKVKGNLNASDRVDIRNEGSLTGDVVAQRISIEDGAFFKGGIDIRKPGAQDNKSKETSSSSFEAPSAVGARA
jgi:cytoskeletal protein CcmA (bactofilin family)